jgi:hypothetical protein
LQAGGTRGGVAIYSDVGAYLQSLKHIQSLSVKHLLLAHPFLPFEKFWLHDNEVSEYFNLCFRFCQEYNQTIEEMMNQQMSPVTLHQANNLFREKYYSQGSRFLTAMTVKAHLDYLTNQGRLKIIVGNGFETWQAITFS